VGKTRLAAELMARCAADRTKVLTGGCVPVGGDGLPFAPIMEALRPLPEEFGADTVREFAGPSWRELARLLPALGEPEAGPAGQVAQVRLFELLLGLLARLSEQTPVALVVEDLHWADQSTRDLLALLVRNLRRERVLLVVSYRSDEPGPTAGVVQARPGRNGGPKCRDPEGGAARRAAKFLGRHEPPRGRGAGHEHICGEAVAVGMLRCRPPEGGRGGEGHRGLDDRPQAVGNELGGQAGHGVGSCHTTPSERNDV
jgi:hypothetical protein